MRVGFVYPSTPQFTAGVAVLYEFANGLARRGHEVHLVHGPDAPDLIADPADIEWFSFAPGIGHHIATDVHRSTVPDLDVAFGWELPARMGQPAQMIQGYKMIRNAWERAAFRAPGPKLCVARWLIDIGRAWGVPPEQLRYVPLGLDHATFRVLDETAERPYDVALLCNPHPVKGWADGLEALVRARAARPALTAVAFGIHDRPADLPAWVDYRRRPRREVLVAEVLNASRCYLQASWREGFGYTAVEAMACGAALVTTDNGGSRDYAEPDVTALVVPPRDVAAMADAVVALHDDPARAHALAARGTDLVRRFDWEIGAEVMEGHLEAYLADPAALQAPPADAPIHLDPAL